MARKLTEKNQTDGMANCESIANSPSFLLISSVYSMRCVLLVHRKMRPIRRLKQKCSDRKMGDIHRQRRPRAAHDSPKPQIYLVTFA